MVANLDVDHAIDLYEDVVLGDGGLVGDGDGLLLERVHVGDAVDPGDEQVDPGAERLDVLAEPLHHERVLLRDDAHAPVDRRGRRVVPATIERERGSGRERGASAVARSGSSKPRRID